LEKGKSMELKQKNWMKHHAEFFTFLSPQWTHWAVASTS
jgi:hypothetical protein